MKKLLGKMEKLDHPLVFVIALSLVLIPLWALAGIGLRKLGLPGPAALIGAAA